VKDQLPKRLIQVGSGRAPPKLILSGEGAGNQCKYITLSHCWGRLLPIQTVKANLQEFSKRIPYEHIPQTFRDAISITKALDISYLWIDALCIVQDCPEEWEAEASKMKHIYAGGFLNIAASDASDSQEGCFPVLNSAKLGTKTCFDAEISNKVAGLVVRAQVGDFRQTTKNTVLSTRGWVLQEQLLSRRMISCMSSNLHWECMKTYQTETGAQWALDGPTSRGTPRLHWRYSVLSLHRVWWSWMQSFSKRNFTSWRDRVPGLCGITQYFQSFAGATPLLGLWRESLLEDLLWIRLSARRPISNEDLTFANLPSWSWLSCPAEIAFDIWQLTNSTDQRNVVSQDHSVVIDCNVEWVGLPLVSVVRSASVILEGPTFDALIRISQRSQESNPPRLDLVWHLDHINSEQQRMVRELECTGQFDHEDAPFTKYICLLLKSRKHIETNTQRTIFVILKPRSNDLIHPMYERVGIACFDGESPEFGSACRKRLVLV
jgi:Heterokaryon incompatibility protein (HET)